jgi:hypothetical protein
MSMKITLSERKSERACSTDTTCSVSGRGRLREEEPPKPLTVRPGILSQPFAAQRVQLQLRKLEDRLVDNGGSLTLCRAVKRGLLEIRRYW